jgi:signal transduction histidine kinase
VVAFSAPTFFLSLFLQLAAISLVSLLLVDRRINDLRLYEDQREHERLMFSYARDGVLLVRVCPSPSHIDGFEFIIQAENPAGSEILAAIGQADNYLGKSLEAALPRWVHERLQSEFASSVRDKSIRRHEICGASGDFAYDSVVTPVMDGSGDRVMHLVVVMRDVTERMRFERTLAGALLRAEQANRAKSDFLASMSHELRTPLNAILGFSEAMSMGVAGPILQKQSEYLRHIHDSGSHLLGIISDILDLAKIEAGQVKLQMRPLQLTDIIDVCMLMVRERALAKGLELRVEGAANAPMVMADPLRIKQVLINLLSNAIKFTDQGSVTVSVEAGPGQKSIAIAVTDTGIGMTQAEAEIAMQPFGRVEGALARNHDGTGLGLPICKELVSLHGGQFALSSCRGHGTRAVLTLPVAAEWPEALSA